MTGVNEIRSTFVEYFKRNGHEHVESSSLVPRNDPTLMFTSAGMVQFKNLFTGQEKRGYSRAVTAQKCLRAGGKHNDLDNVGYTARHHTFFEMLGNFSFGDYFKERAIELAWNLVTKEYGLKKDKLIITVYSEDEEAAALWRKIAGFSDDKIIRIPTSDNFWSAGDTGPCGPCSEIFIDQGDKLQGGPPGSPDADGDRFLEFWNLVFMQFDQVAPGHRQPLPRPSIDTGMGLERISAILQGVYSNYDTDLFRALIEASVSETGVPAKGDKTPSHRVIADHLRASSFLIADGVLPSNEGRGYVLRRIMRRAMRHAHLLGAKDPLMHRLVPVLVRQMGTTYPELVQAQALISETLKLEEIRFRKTLERGLGLLDEASNNLRKGDVFAGDVAFRLYDTFGFPLDLTQDALKPRGIEVDLAAFNAAMEKQKEEARRAWRGSGEAATEGIWFEVKEEVGATEFLGYDVEQAEAVVKGTFAKGKAVDALSAGQFGEIVVNQTPFYGESGGQVGDSGIIKGPGGALFRVTDTQKKLGVLWVHAGTVESGRFKPGDQVDMVVDHERRTSIRANHSATHLIHEALRQVLGTHVAQKGSLVAPERLRFDISHNKPMSPDEIGAVEAMANAYVLQNSPVETRLMSLEDARETGAMALFGEKYGDEVRVVSMGVGTAGAKANKPWSIELCGGTHVRRTGDIGLIRIVGESASAAGVRRIEAVTAEGARAYLAEQDGRVKELAGLLRTRPEEIVDRVKSLVETQRQLERQLAEAKRALALGGGGQAGGANGASGGAIKTIGSVRLLARSVEGLNPKDLRGLVDDGKKQVGSGIVAIVGVTEDGKAGLAVGVTEDLVESWDARELVKAGSEALGGKGGGGRPDMAQAGGPDGSKAGAALKAIEARLAG
ncbi:MAG: alanine--tRNA ligase [Hyphomicrobiaceae bacterium]|nr:alanine--tRNA ligase [Hyphomicrobiaceae bacterium]